MRKKRREEAIYMKGKGEGIRKRRRESELVISLTNNANSPDHPTKLEAYSQNARPK